MLLLATPTRAQTTTQTYLVTRDRLIAALSAPTRNRADDDATLRRGQATLLPILRTLVGPIALRGFPDQPRLNNDALNNDAFTDDAGTDQGRLDGLRLISTDRRTLAIVTTESLLRAWLADPRAWQRGQAPTLPAALRAPDFYFAALRNNAAANKALDLPVTARGQAGAILFQFAQDRVGAHPPDRIAVTVLHNGRLTILIQHAAVPPIPACQAALDRAVKAAAPLPVDQANKAVDGAYDAAERCVDQALPKQRGYPALIRQAQALVDLALVDQSAPP